jgi:hypothetical protein
MIFQRCHRIDDHVILPGNLLKHRPGIFGCLRFQDSPAAFPNPHQTAFEMADRMPALPHGTRVVPSLWQAETHQTMALVSFYQQTGEHPTGNGQKMPG